MEEISVIWAAKNCDDRKSEIIDIVGPSNIQDADLAAQRIPFSIIVINSKFPYRCFLSDWEKNSTPFYIVSLEKCENTYVEDFKMCIGISYL